MRCFRNKEVMDFGNLDYGEVLDPTLVVEKLSELNM